MISSEGPKVVYWLGAGASRHALPIVNDMPAAFEAQAKFIELVKFDPPINREHIKHYSGYLQRMARWAKQFGTIDTYARSLYLLGQNEALAQLKLHLSLYFTIEQALPLLSGDERESFGVRYWKRDRIDTRYMGWLALVMDRVNGLNARVNIISWNYDLQLEHAIALYQGLDNMGKLACNHRFSSYPLGTSIELSGMKHPSLVHLNGIAGLSQQSFPYKRLFDGIGGLEVPFRDFISALLEQYFQYLHSSVDSLLASFRPFTFSWEDDEQAKTGLAYAKMMLAEATVLVIIGYSFPSFNRKNDKEIFSGFLDGDYRSKRIVIQNEYIEPSTFKEMVGQRSEPPKIRQERNLDQFYVPKELF